MAAIIVTFVLDQVSKWIIIRELGPDSARDVVTVIPGVLRLLFVRNTGSAFGLFQGSSDALKFLAIIAVAILGIYYARTATRDPLLSVALGLQVGGALGNIVDRFRYGYVVDWIDLPHWPTFNIADSAITVGVALLAYTLIFRADAAPETREGSAEGRRSSTTASEEA